MKTKTNGTRTDVITNQLPSLSRCLYVWRFVYDSLHLKYATRTINSKMKTQNQIATRPLEMFIKKIQVLNKYFFALPGRKNQSRFECQPISKQCFEIGIDFYAIIKQKRWFLKFALLWVVFIRYFFSDFSTSAVLFTYELFIKISWKCSCIKKKLVTPLCTT